MPDYSNTSSCNKIITLTRNGLYSFNTPCGSTIRNSQNVKFAEDNNTITSMKTIKLESAREFSVSGARQCLKVNHKVEPSIVNDCLRKGDLYDEKDYIPINTRKEMIDSIKENSCYAFRHVVLKTILV